MFNWNTDEKKLKKDHPKTWRIWRMTQMINYGLEGEKLDEAEVRAAWPQIKEKLAINRKKTLEWLLWRKKWEKPKGLLPDKSNFWSWYSANRTS